MTDSLVQLVHDTIFRVDTVLIANTALNSVKDQSHSLPEYMALLISVTSGLVLFGLTLIKDLVFHKKKDLSEKDKYKFEKEHDKTVQIAECIVKDLNELFLDIIDYRRMIYQNSSNNTNTDQISQYKQRIENYIRGLRIQVQEARLYLDISILGQILDLTGELNSTTL